MSMCMLTPLDTNNKAKEIPLRTVSVITLLSRLIDSSAKSIITDRVVGGGGCPGNYQSVSTAFADLNNPNGCPELFNPGGSWAFGSTTRS